MQDQKISVPGIEHDNESSQASSMQSYYELHAKIYDITRWTFLFGRKGIIRALPVDPNQEMTILEVGCGTGYNLGRLAKRFPKAQLIGVDVSKEMLAKSKKATLAHSDRVRLVGEPYGFESNIASEPVDILLCSYSLTMINPQWQEVVLKAKEDLREGGIFAAVDFHASRFKWFERHMGNNHVRMDGHLVPFFKEHFETVKADVKSAYGGVWEYFMYVGKKK